MNQSVEGREKKSFAVIGLKAKKREGPNEGPSTPN